MMRSLFSLMLLSSAILVMVVFADFGESNVYVIHGNSQKEPLEITLESYFCSQDKVPIMELLIQDKLSNPMATRTFLMILEVCFCGSMNKTIKTRLFYGCMQRIRNGMF